MQSVGVGTPIAGRPLHRSRRAAFPHRAPASSTDGKWLAVSAPSLQPPLPGAESGAWWAVADSSSPGPFPPLPPLPVARRCSEASSVLWARPTSPARTSSACVLGLPDAPSGTSTAGGTGDLPVLVRGASVHAQGLRPRGTPERLASNDALSVAFRPSDSVGVPNNPAFAAQYPAYTYPCQRLTSCLTTDRPGLGAGVVR